MSLRTLFIPAAGRGSRLKTTEFDLPKPLVTLGDLPAISRVIDLYPKNWRIVIGVGYKSQIVRDAISALYENSGSDRTIDFVETDSWERQHSGLSQTLLDSREALGDDPFVFHAVDSVIRDSTSAPIWSTAEKDTLVTGIPLDSGIYRHIMVNDLGEPSWQKGLIEPLGQSVYIGIASVINIENFWDRLKSFAALNPEDGETLGMIPSDSQIIEVQYRDWIDIGSIQGIQRARSEFATNGHILQKPAEAIWFRDGRVIKVHTNMEFIKGRVERAKALNPYVPEITSANSHTYTYGYVEGETLSSVAALNPMVYKALYTWLERFWSANALSAQMFQGGDYRPEYEDFYKNKTLNRVKTLTNMYPEIDTVRQVNGREVLPLNQLLAGLDWQSLCRPIMGRAHGDLHSENIVVSSSGDFKLLDWRQDMAGSVEAFGDVYYDIAKLSHGFSLDHGEIAQGNYSAAIDGEGNARYSLKIPESKILAKREFIDTFTEGPWSMDRVRALEGLIFLNIACLHDPKEYSLLLAMMGIEILTQMSSIPPVKNIDRPT